MTIETIDAAILAHRTWVAKFQTVFKGINTEAFDIAKARDDSICDLGRWLRSDYAQELLGPDSHLQIMAIHATFHEIAGDIATRLNRCDCDEETRAWLVEFDNLSSQLVTLLMQTKKKL